MQNKNALTTFINTITSCGDDRLFLDPQKLTNSYGLSFLSSLEESDKAGEFGSCTCNSLQRKWIPSLKKIISEYETCVSEDSQKNYLKNLYNRIRNELSVFLNIQQEQIYFSPSGSDVPYYLLNMMSSVSEKPITSIVVGVEEMGRGTRLSSEGKMHSSRTPFFSKINSTQKQVELVLISLRDSVGDCRLMSDIENDLETQVKLALAKGHQILIQSVWSSKTDLAAPSDHFLCELKLSSDDIWVLVDGAQGRWFKSQIQNWLSKHFFVNITGSKFFSGPPFSGALLRPKIKTHLSDQFYLNRYFSELDLATCIDKIELQFGNFPLMLRWQAALFEISEYNLIDQEDVRLIKSAWYQITKEFLADQLLDKKQLEGEGSLDSKILASQTILSFSVLGRGHYLNEINSKSLHQFLAKNNFFIGQPVKIAADKFVLRLALSSRMICQWSEQKSAKEKYVHQLHNLERLIQTWKKTMMI